MSREGEKFDRALDRWITGNYGEDQFRGKLQKEDFYLVCETCGKTVAKLNKDNECNGCAQ